MRFSCFTGGISSPTEIKTFLISPFYYTPKVIIWSLCVHTFYIHTYIGKAISGVRLYVIYVRDEGNLLYMGRKVLYICIWEKLFDAYYAMPWYMYYDGRTNVFFIARKKFNLNVQTFIHTLCTWDYYWCNDWRIKR